ncbi:MAG: hypothetical protein ACI9HU_000632 [Colwellia sp.]|jgi:hypothetical protein
MKVYKMEVMVLDFEGDSEEDIKALLSNSKYIHAKIMRSEIAEIEWSDDHPLNHCGTSARAYQDLFAVNKVNN